MAEQRLYGCRVVDATDKKSPSSRKEDKRKPILFYVLEREEDLRTFMFIYQVKVEGTGKTIACS
jgi:hypothetical protein